MNLNPFDLQRFWRKVYSQWGEDGITLELIRRLNPPRTFLEIGAGHNGENCTHVLLDRDWSGFWVEGNPEHFVSLFREVSSCPRLTLVREQVRSDNVRMRLGSVRDTFGSNIGVFSLDIDGNDYWIWKELCTEFIRPVICIIECNVQKPLDQPYIMPENHNFVWDHKTHEFGASVLSMIDLGCDMGYTFVGLASSTPQHDSPNAFFVRDDYVNRL